MGQCGWLPSRPNGSDGKMRRWTEKRYEDETKMNNRSFLMANLMGSVGNCRDLG